MRNQILAAVILTSYVPVRGDERAILEPPRDGIGISVNVIVDGERQIREITATMPAPADPADVKDDRLAPGQDAGNW